MPCEPLGFVMNMERQTVVDPLFLRLLFFPFPPPFPFLCDDYIITVAFSVYM